MNIGEIIQYQGPFEENYSISISPSSENKVYKIGVSVSEKDFMKYGKKGQKNNSIKFMINNQQIQLGRTQMYESKELFIRSNISFPDGAPSSTLVEIVYYNIDSD